MKLLLATRGTQGDIHPYLAIAWEFQRRGHEVVLSLPRKFEKEAQACGVKYTLQQSDEIDNLTTEEVKPVEYLEWMRRNINYQFQEYIPMLRECDIMVCANTEFAGVSVAEYCGKPCVRTSLDPLIPSDKIKPAVLFHPLVPAPVLWGTVNFGANYLAQKTINANRRRLGMEPIKNFTLHSAAKAKNFLIHSEYLGETDDGWQYEWEIGGYCFNDRYPCDEGALQRFRAFAAKDSKPLIFFTLGSCQAPNRDEVCAWLFDYAKKRNCKLAVGSGWGKTGMDLAGPDYLVLDTFIPHSLVFPLCDYLVHHGGSGTTHSASRSGKPQLIVPLLLDQPYWSHRVRKLRLGPLCKKMGRLSRKYFEKKMDDLIGNSAYKKNAALLASQMEREKGLQSICDYVEKTVREYKEAG